MNVRARRVTFALILALILIGGGTWLYRTLLAPTRIALINFPSYQVSNFVLGNDDARIRVTAVGEAEIHSVSKYDAILIFGAGFRPTPQAQEALQAASKRGTPIYAFVMRSNMLPKTNLTEEEQAVLDLYHKNRCQHNYREMLKYIRQQKDQYKLFRKEAEPPLILPDNFYYHLAEDQFFQSASELQQHLQSEGYYHEGGKHIALITGILAPMEGNRGHIDLLIEALHQRGYNVFPIIAEADARLAMLEEVKPSAIIYLPMGRLAGAEAGEWLTEHDVPLFCPVPVSQTEELWLADKIGLSAGSLTARIVLPEIDGGVMPIAISCEKSSAKGEPSSEATAVTIEAYEAGLQLFVEKMDRYLRLKETPRKDKRLAIVYFKGVGQQPLVASGLEVLPSLYSLLHRLQREGYDLTGLPNSLQAFEKELMQRGAFWAHNDTTRQERLLAQQPLLIPLTEYQKLFTTQLSTTLQKAVTEQYGLPEEDPYLIEQNGEEYLPIPALTYGHVTLLPQLPSSYSEDQYEMSHGAPLPPPHSFIAMYLWIQHQLQPDALLHFGTHGTLEFTPQKQVALTMEDWPQLLTGSTPHLYYYSIGNVGESIIAKRRTHATILSYLTPPFMESGLQTVYQRLEDLLEQVRTAPDSLTMHQEGLKLKEILVEEQLHQDLGLDSLIQKPYSEVELQRIEDHLAELATARVTGSLHITGEPYTPHLLLQSAIAMGRDPIAYAWAELDLALGKINRKEYESQSYMSKHYLSKVTTLASAHLQQGHPRPMQELLLRPYQSLQDSLQIELRSQVAQSISQLFEYHHLLQASPEAELQAILHALDGGYTPPSPGGDAIQAPNALPTGRNLYAINVESTPTLKAWNVGKSLAEASLQQYKSDHGSYPRKVSYTFWAGEFIASEGATIAQALATLGVEPLRDKRGRVTDLRLIPLSELGRPRIDVVVQVSGQLRDLAFSRLTLINKAIELVAQAEESEGDNYIRSSSKSIEQSLVQQGLAPEEARRLSSKRLFGGLHGRYGTGIKDLVEQGNQWQDRSELAEVYLQNMGALYSDEAEWGVYHEGLLKAVLQETDLVIQPRQNNTWGPLSLDHVYEFMGGISNSISSVTGKEPEMYMADYRNRFRPRMQRLSEAIGVESRTTLFNPNYIRERMQGGATTANTISKTIRNAYGWCSMRPETLSNEWWHQLYDTYIEDKHQLGITQHLEAVSPASLQEITAVMLESARKDFWHPTTEQLEQLATLHQELNLAYGSSQSDFIRTNTTLQQFIQKHAKAPMAASGTPSPNQQKSIQLEAQSDTTHRSTTELQQATPSRFLWILLASVGALLLAILLTFLLRRSRK